MNKKLIASLTICLTMLPMTACVHSTPDSPQETSATATTAATAVSETSEGSSSEAISISGSYASGRATAEFENTADGSIKILVHWGASYDESAQWRMTGKFDPATNKITYSDCKKTEVKFDSNGAMESEKVIYEGGSGSFIFDKSGDSFTWQDEKENAADGMTFTKYTK